MRRNIVLIGMPGAGKSTIGVLMAKALGMDFIDTDLLIQQKEERLLQDIINSDGIDNFLCIEEKAIIECYYSNAVIATGGSVIYSEKSIDYLRRNDGLLIYLYIGYEEMINRIKNINTRGVVIKKGQSLEDLYNEREVLYRKHADLIIDCSSMSHEEVLNKIIKNYK